MSQEERFQLVQGIRDARVGGVHIPPQARADMIHHHRILTRVGSLVEAGELRSPLTEVLGPIDATGLRQAHRRMESGSTIGKLVLAGWT